jgi:cytochrome bd-type quinol oxidase subunit 2
MVMPSLGIFSFPVLMGAGWLAAHLSPELSRLLARGIGLLAAILLTLLCGSGVLSLFGVPVGVPDELHRWTGHGLVIIVWQGVPFSMGVLLRRQIRRSPLTAILQTLALLICLFATLFASFSGYLNIPPDSPSNTETHGRFTVLHLFVSPTLLAFLLFVWIWSFRRVTNLSAPNSEPHSA